MHLKMSVDTTTKNSNANYNILTFYVIDFNYFMDMIHLKKLYINISHFGIVLIWPIKQFLAKSILNDATQNTF